MNRKWVAPIPGGIRGVILDFYVKTETCPCVRIGKRLVFRKSASRFSLSQRTYVLLWLAHRPPWFGVSRRLVAQQVCVLSWLRFGTIMGSYIFRRRT